MKLLPPWALPAAAIILILAGFSGGWGLRSLKADSDSLRAQKAASEAENRLRVALADKSALYEAARAELDTRRTSATSTIREIYRDVPAPPPVCAAPPAARSLLIDLGATGASAASGEPRR